MGEAADDAERNQLDEIDAREDLMVAAEKLEKDIDYFKAALRVCVGALEDAKKGDMSSIEWALKHCKPLCEMEALR